MTGNAGLHSGKLHFRISKSKRVDVQKALLKNFFACGWAKISTVIFRLIGTYPSSFLGIEDYGRWLVLYALPSWLSVANLRRSVAANDMSMAIGKGDANSARTMFSSTFRVVCYIFVGGILLFFPLIFLFHWERFLQLPSARHQEITGVLIWFTLSTLLSFFGDIFQARFRAARKAHSYMLLYSFRPWLELIFMLIVLQFTTRLDYLASSVFFSTIIFLISVQWLSLKAMPSLTYSRHWVEKGLLKHLFRKGIAFQAFPLGNALIYQGNILVIQMILGPAAVAVFGSARTLVRSINQMLELISQVMWPELSILFRAGHFAKAARLHRIGVLVSVVPPYFRSAFIIVREKVHLVDGRFHFITTRLLLLFFANSL
jgi:O-antigen/teichoic acid export membrane protein